MKIFSHGDGIGDNALRIKAIADTPGALVYVFVGEAERKAKAGTVSRQPARTCARAAFPFPALSR